MIFDSYTYLFILLYWIVFFIDNVIFLFIRKFYNKVCIYFIYIKKNLMLAKKKFNRDISVNIYKLDFLSSYFSSQPNKKVFYHSTSLLPTKQKWEKLKLFLSSQPKRINHLSLSPFLSFVFYKSKGIQIFSYKVMYTLSFLFVLVDVSTIMNDQL